MLLDRTEYKSLTGTTDSSTDAQIDALLPAASQAVETFTGRQFVVATPGVTPRSFLYDGSGFLDIDDCSGVTGVNVLVPNTDPVALDTTEFTAMPDGGLVNYYLIIHGGARVFASSPEMGFERNLDQYPATLAKSPTLSVTATWGWPSIPFDVKLATALTVQELLSTLSSSEGENLSAEAIEGWSRSWGGKSSGTTALAIPNRARDLLVAYQRVFL